MKHPEAAGQPTADQPLDEADSVILNDICEMFQAADPMPADLPERIRFSLSLRHLEFEVARLCAEEDQPVLAVRGVEQSRTITFESDSLTIMIRGTRTAMGRRGSTAGWPRRIRARSS
jgi:hypothetical protein